MIVMKTIQATFKCLTVILCIAVGACQKESKTDQEKQMASLSYKKEANTAPQKLSWNPEGSIIEINGNTMTVTAPKEWSYIGYDREGKLFNIASMASKSISCTCNNASGECRPFEATAPLGGGTISGCAGACTNCTMKQSMSMEDHGIQAETGGYYTLSAMTTVLKNGQAAPAVFDAIFELSAFRMELERFYKEAYQGKPTQRPIGNSDGSVSAPKGHSIIGISIMGRGMAVVVPDFYAMKELGYVVHAKAKCSCDQGSCSLKDSSILGAGLVYCAGQCNTCTLTTESLRNNDGQYVVQLPSFAL